MKKNATGITRKQELKFAENIILEYLALVNEGKEQWKTIKEVPMSWFFYYIQKEKNKLLED